MIEIRARIDERAARLRHLRAVDGHEAVHVHRGRRAQARAVQHRRPEQRVEIDDVLADEVDHFGAGFAAAAGSMKSSKRSVDRRISRSPRRSNRETTTDSRSAHRPRRRNTCPADPGISKPKYGASREMSQLRRPSANHSCSLLTTSLCRPPTRSRSLQPRLQHRFEIGELDEEMRRFLLDRLRAGHDRVRLDQVGRVVGLAADLAGVAVLVLAVAVRAFALDEAVRQEHLLDRIVELLDRPRFGVAGRDQRVPDAIRQLAVRRRCRSWSSGRARRRNRAGRACAARARPRSAPPA